MSQPGLRYLLHMLVFPFWIYFFPIDAVPQCNLSLFLCFICPVDDDTSAKLGIIKYKLLEKYFHFDIDNNSSGSQIINLKYLLPQNCLWKIISLF